jgi:hypothetical protein
MIVQAVASHSRAQGRLSRTAQSGPVVAMTLTSTVGGSNLPFAFGQAFKQGDVANAAALGGDTAVQVTAKNLWPDGSLKYAIISGRKTLSANTPAAVTLSNGGTVASGSNLSITDLKATGITASIAYGAYGTVSWADTDFDTPFQTLTTGPELSSWAYRKAIGSDAHLVGWIEVRLHAGGAVCVLAWIENAYLTVASPGARSGTATLTVGGSQRYSAAMALLNHQRAVLGSGTTWWHWLGTDPVITPKHDVAYLQATKLVPAYRANSSSSTALFARLATSYTPLAQHNHHDPMGEAGYQSAIGLLPEWDVAYLTAAADVRAYRAVVINALGVGRYGMHFRDQATNRPLLFSSYPNLVMEGSSNGVANTGSGSQVTPTASGGVPPAFDGAHHPSFGYMAYLLTGWNWFLEELQFIATGNFLRNGTGNRNNSSGVFRSNAGSDITRGAAWSTRTLAQAACLTPDADALRTEFVNSVNANVDWYHGRYVAQANNPLGVVEPYDTTYSGVGWQGAIWMDDFFTASYGYMKDLQVASGASVARLDAFCAWKYQSIVGRLGGAGDAQFSYRYAEQYTLSYAPGTDGAADFAGGTGPWYADWAAVARAEGIANDAAAGASLVGSYVGVATGYTSNYQPAIAYAVDHGATGAAAAYARLTAASNWAAHIATYTDDPVWSVKPRTA